MNMQEGTPQALKRLREQDNNTAAAWNLLYKNQRHLDVSGGFAVVHSFLLGMLVQVMQWPPQHIRGIIDVGCGKGAGLFEIWKHSDKGEHLKFLGLDLSEVVCQYNYKNYAGEGIVYEVFDCNKDVFKPEWSSLYNLGISLHTMEHIDKLYEHVENFLNYLDYYVILVPYLKHLNNSPEHINFFDAHSFDEFKPEHVLFLEKAEDALINQVLHDTVIYILKGKGNMSNESGSKRGKGRPPLTQRENIVVETPTGSSVPVKIEMPVASDAVVTKLEVRTRKELEHPQTSEENKAHFNEDFFKEQNQFPHVMWVQDSKRIQVKYALTYLGYPKHVLVAGCATGHELLAYNEAGIPCTGQEVNEDAVRLALPPVREQIKLGEWYDLIRPDTDTVQFIEVLQYMQDDVYDATLMHLKNNKQIKNVVVEITNAGYQYQIQKRAQPETIDEALSSDFEKINDKDDHWDRHALLMGKYEGCYGVFPQKLIWVYRRREEGIAPKSV